MMDQPTFQWMITISRANPQYHDLFHVVTPEDNSMIQEARSITNVVLRGIGSSICTDVLQCYGCSAVKPVGDAVEGFLWFGLMECPPEDEACQLAREFFWLARDMRDIFPVGRSTASTHVRTTTSNSFKKWFASCVGVGLRFYLAPSRGSGC